jgi:hypothetical protein
VDGTGSESCPNANVSISSVEHSDSTSKAMKPHGRPTSR